MNWREDYKNNLTGKTFKEQVYFIVSQIPEGEVLTYKEVAELAGRPLACRAVGTILSKNYDPQIPCHRVVRSDGRLGEYNRGASQKERLLAKEKAKLNRLGLKSYKKI